MVMRTTLPFVTIRRAGANTVSRIPPNGRTVLPGRKIATSSKIGAKIFATAYSSARVARIGQSIPINNFRPLKRLLIFDVIPSDKGPIAGPNQLPTNANSSRATAPVKAKVKISATDNCPGFFGSQAP